MDRDQRWLSPEERGMAREGGAYLQLSLESSPCTLEYRRKLCPSYRMRANATHHRTPKEFEGGGELVFTGEGGEESWKRKNVEAGRRPMFKGPKTLDACTAASYDGRRQV